ncbi:hypothetical protein [Isoptericola sp. NPDC057391]|uniref:hypothetical protein n=1 Tax=Isoptericola sp. NPDC057391 TaxID=3346117 RepID=UPI003631D9DE
MVLALAAAVGAAVLVARPWQDVPPTMRPAVAPEEERSVSVDFGIVTDPGTDWAAIDRHLDAAGANSVDLNAGRVEFTAFDWPAHPDAAAEPGTDHLSRAARAVREGPDGTPRQIGLIVDAFVPEWIRADRSIAGVAADGSSRSPYRASASQLATGEVGDRLVEYVTDLGERYDPSRIAVTELFLDHLSFGDDDLALYREMTGADDWPRDAGGEIDEDSPELGAWRSEVLAGLLARMRAGLDGVRGGQGERIELAMDVRVDWDDPAAGVPSTGHDYEILLRSADRLVVWAYVGQDRTPAEVEGLTAALEEAGYDMSRFTVSVGLWAGAADADPPQAITPGRMAETAEAAGTHGVTDVNVTPLSHLSDAHWAAFAELWGPSSAPGSVSPSPPG